MKKYFTGKKILNVAILFWFAETAYFGFNLTAQSHSERVCDWIVSLLIVIAVILMLPPLKMYEDFLSSYYKKNK